MTHIYHFSKFKNSWLRILDASFINQRTNSFTLPYTVLSYFHFQLHQRIKSVKTEVGRSDSNSLIFYVPTMSEATSNSSSSSTKLKVLPSNHHDLNPRFCINIADDTTKKVYEWYYPQQLVKIPNLNFLPTNAFEVATS